MLADRKDAILSAIFSTAYFSCFVHLLSICCNRFIALQYKDSYGRMFTKRTVIAIILIDWAFGVLSSIPSATDSCILLHYLTNFSIAYHDVDSRIATITAYKWYTGAVNACVFVMLRIFA
ncbi:unnamed protein product [Soboliphyme baturini]|uniref:7TM_GPCR_Srx domain-containing protein n=1 Tax=Soboliphyme baturini TaxID=241478 RepID=A0A183IG29_9BILA|nr:unnamed protein product [Soboliphyme baturini]